MQIKKGAVIIVIILAAIGAAAFFFAQRLIVEPEDNSNFSSSRVPLNDTYGFPRNQVLLDGTIIKDGNAFYVVEYGKVRRFSSLDIFNDMGYSIENVKLLDTSTIPKGFEISTADQRHPRGSLVVFNKTVYFLGEQNRYAFTSEAIFESWEYSFSQVIPANTHDLALPNGEFIKLK